MRVMKNLKELLEKATYDELAFRDIYENTVDRVFGYVLVRVGNRDNAKEITQEVYLSLFQSFPNFRYESDEAFYGFLWKITRRQIIKSRRKKRVKTVPFLPEYDIPEEESYEDYQYLIHALQNLKETYRAVIELRYFQHYSFHEIANSLGITETNAKVIHQRAIHKLRESIRTHE